MRNQIHFTDSFKSGVSNKRQWVVLPGTRSDWVYILVGVPQGSILGPILCFIIIGQNNLSPVGIFPIELMQMRSCLI